MIRSLTTLCSVIFGATIVFFAYLLHLGLAEQLADFNTWPMWLRAAWCFSELLIFPVDFIPNVIGLLLSAVLCSTATCLLRDRRSPPRTNVKPTDALMNSNILHTPADSTSQAIATWQTFHRVLKNSLRIADQGQRVRWRLLDCCANCGNRKRSLCSKDLVQGYGVRVSLMVSPCS
jgi:hypothetical protein